LDQAEGVEELARLVQAGGRSVVLFSGYRLEEIEEKGFAGVLEYCDVLVDGRFEVALPESQNPAGVRRWLGSSNQRLHFLTDRYSEADFKGSNTVEIRIVNGKVVISGWPEETEWLKRRG
jgi:anaerobic ribonucleoside-triphosphate reductase activating protein